METRFSGILHAKRSVDKATGLSGTVQINCPLFDGSVDVVELFKFHPAGKTELRAFAGDKEVGMLTGRMRTTRTTVTKDGTFIYVSFEGSVDNGYNKLDHVLGEHLDFTLSMDPDEQDQLELDEE